VSVCLHDKSSDPLSPCTILEAIRAGVGWVWEGDYMSTAWYCTSGVESIATATVPSLVPRPSTPPVFHHLQYAKNWSYRRPGKKASCTCVSITFTR